MTIHATEFRTTPTQMQDKESGPASMQLTNKNSEDAVPGPRGCEFVIVGSTTDNTIQGDFDLDRDVNCDCAALQPVVFQPLAALSSCFLRAQILFTLELKNITPQDSVSHQRSPFTSKSSIQTPTRHNAPTTHTHTSIKTRIHIPYSTKSQ